MLLDRYGISNFTFRGLKPFHPQRLADIVTKMNSRTGLLGSVIRAKGIVWLATEYGIRQQAIVSLAGNSLPCSLLLTNVLIYV